MIWLSYLGFEDSDAFWINLFFVPVFGGIALVIFNANNAILKIFAVLMFIGHAIGAPFYWLGRNSYLPTGFSAIGNFEFHLDSFFLIYVWVLLIYGSLALITLKLDSIISANHWTVQPCLLKTNYKDSDWILKSRNNILFDIYILGFIFFIMVPLSFHMSNNRIGIVGIESQTLPYRLTGIMTYFRLYFGPLLILLLYSKSSRRWFLVITILLYATYAGICSASRTLLVINTFCLIYFAIIDHQKIRLLVIITLGLFGFLLVGGSRDYTYMSSEFLFFDAISAGVSNILSGNITPIVIIGNLANRFFGAQDMILAYQFVREDVWSATFNYFISGGFSNTIVPDLGRDLFGMNLEGTGFGVGIGVIAYFLIIGNSNILVIPFAILFLSFLISAGNWLLNYFLFKMMSRRLLPYNFSVGPLKFALSGFMAFTLYSSSIKIFYYVCLLFLVIAIIISFVPRLNILPR